MGRAKGSKQTPEARERIAAANRARWADPAYRERMKAKHRERAAATGNAQQKVAAQASAAKIKGTRKTPEQTARSVAARREKNGGRYWRKGGGPAVHMDAGPAHNHGPQEYTGEHPEKSQARRAAIAEGRGVGWKHTEETKQRMSESRRQMWADGVYEGRKPAIRRRVSRMELSLVPYLAELGYTHVDDEHPFFIPHPEGGMVPDFVDREGRRVFEFFGDYWHAPEDEPEKIRRYAESGWACTVLWEHDMHQWIETHTTAV